MHAGEKRPVSEGRPPENGDAMPKLTSKVTIKFEPKLLDILQELADSEGLPVSSYIRKAVIEYIGERHEEGTPHTLRVELTEMELRVIERLIGLGYIRRGEEIFHTSFALFLRQEYETIRIMAEREYLDAKVLGGGSLPSNAFSRSAFMGDLDEKDEEDGDEKN
ncbi:MAG: ribbon-helix-helix protein, CopG family [Thermoplasmatota archaeon]